jgi:hypothetical protein
MERAKEGEMIASTKPAGRMARKAAFVALSGAVTVVMLALPGVATTAPQAPPRATAEPVISGRAEQGRQLSASRGSWTGGGLKFAYRWVRCNPNGGLPDGSDCTMIAGADGSHYVLTASDVGFRLRVRVTATNADGSQTSASNPTAIVVGAPVNTSIPIATGSTFVDGTITVQPGSWTGRQPIGFSYSWVRCNSAGGDCVAIAGATGRTYRLTSADVGHKVRCSVTARNAIGATTVLSSESGVVSVPLPAGAVRLPGGAISIPPTSVPADQRLVVSQVVFAPAMVRSRSEAITVRVRVSDTRGYVVRDAIVFVRSTPRVTSGSRLLTGMDGWMTTRVVPLSSFPLRRQGHVQFFVKAYRSGDPALGGVAGYRLVQVRTAAP